MAKKEMTLVIRARNAVASGLRGAWGAISGFGARVAGVFGGVFRNLMNIYAGIKMISGAFQAVGKAMSAYAEQERASRALASSLSASGDNAAALVPKLQAVASAIQDETGADDDAVIAMMARLRLMGVTADKLAEAARGTIALKSAGLEETAASKAVAMAMQGSYDMLNRYVPALRVATTESEKQRIVADLLAKGYAQQKAVLNTTGGAWMALKGRIGDAWEEIGKAIERSFGIRDALNKAGDAVKKFGERVSEWIDSEKFVALQTTIQGIIGAMKSAEGRGEVLAAVGDVLKAAFAVAAENAVTLLKNAAPVIGHLIGSAAKAAMKKVPLWIHTPQSEIDAAMKQLGISYPEKSASRKLTEAFLQIPTPEKMGFSGLPKELREAVKARILLNRETGKGIEKTKSQIEEENRLSVALKNLSAIAAKYAPQPFVGPLPQTSDLPAVQEDADARIDAGKEAFEKLLEERKRLLEEYAQAEKDAAEKELALAEELAKKKIAAFIQENKEKAKEEKQAARDAEKEADRAAILKDRVRKGGRLSKRQQEWLDAFNAIAAAKGQLQPLRDQIKVAEDNLAQLQQTNRTLAEIQKGLDQNHVALNALMQLG